ncbi:MAG: hypothetical protein K2P35_04270 [Lachnospiraceae bacterium]|nr:hypothetical protein [Lachnospiraceae bacterium]
MNAKDLYEKADYDVYSIYYTDKECTQPYTGHVEEYWNGKLCWESDIVNGYGEGIRKEYDNIHDVLETVIEVKHNKANGLGFDYHRNGRIASIGISIDDIDIDYYLYDETGKLMKEFHVSEPYDTFEIRISGIKEKIPAIREKYNLKKINEEILKYGKPMKYGMPIYPIQCLDDEKGV